MCCLINKAQENFIEVTFKVLSQQTPENTYGYNRVPVTTISLGLSSHTQDLANEK
jgi:hypothetical protein